MINTTMLLCDWDNLRNIGRNGYVRAQMVLETVSAPNIYHLQLREGREYKGQLMVSSSR